MSLLEGLVRHITFALGCAIGEALKSKFTRAQAQSIRFGIALSNFRKFSAELSRGVKFPHSSKEELRPGFANPSLK